MGSTLSSDEEPVLAPPRLTRTMSSRKLQALDFIKRYFAKWGHSPTLGELAAEMGVSNKRAHDLVHQLADQQMIEREVGKTRGIRLVDRGHELSEADVLLILSARGWTIGRGSMVVLPPDAHLAPTAAPHASIAGGGLTEKGLPRLDFVPDNEPSKTGVGNGGPGRQRSAARGRAGSAEGSGRQAGV